MMEEKQKISFFHKFIYSIKNIEKYPELAIKSFGEVLLYLIKLLLIFTVIISVAYTVKIATEMNKVVSFMREEVPDFEIKNGVLVSENKEAYIKKDITENLNIVILDTSENLDEITINNYKDKLLDNENGIAFLRNKILIKTNVTNGVMEYNNSEMSQAGEISNITKSDLLSYFTGKKAIIVNAFMFITIFVYMFMLYSVEAFLNVVLLTVLGYISTIFMRMRIRLNALCKIAIHSLTLPIILNIIVVLIELFTSFKVKYFEIMYVVIAYIYIVAAISMIRVDIIKNKEELLNVLEEQKRVKEELDRQEEEKKRQKEQEEKEKQKEKEDHKDNEKQEDKNNKDNDAPQSEGT